MREREGRERDPGRRKRKPLVFSLSLRIDSFPSRRLLTRPLLFAFEKTQKNKYRSMASSESFL